MNKIARISKACFWVIIILAMVLMHIYKIGEIPYGINVDEMGMGYDSWCLAHYGTDRYLNSFPVYLINFGGGQSALYAYLCAPFVYLFGISAVTLRIPAVIFSFVSLFFLIKLSLLIWNNEYISMVVAGLYTVLPVFTMLSRIGLDCNLMLPTSIVFLYLLMKALKEMRYRYFILAGVGGGIVLYSYVLSHLVLPLFLLLCIIYLFVVHKFDLKKILAFSLPLLLFAIPLILFHVVNWFGLNELKIGFLTIPKLPHYRSDDLEWSPFYNSIKTFCENTLLYDKVAFNSIPKFGNIYIISIPFLGIGVVYMLYKCVKSFVKRSFCAHTLIINWIICVYVTAEFLGTGGPAVYHVNSIYMCYLLAIVEGIYVVFLFIRKYSRVFSNIFAGVLCAAYICQFAMFAKYYFYDYTNDTYLIDLFNFTFDDVLDYMESELPEGVSERTTYIVDGNQTYIFYLGSEQLSPYEYNKIESDDDYYESGLRTQSYENYRFDFPEEFDPAGNYIVPETSAKYIEMYEAYGLKAEHIGTHYLFWNDMLSGDESNGMVSITWDHGIDDSGVLVVDDSDKTVLSGWATDEDYDLVWDDIIVQVGDTYYVAEKMERKDVADAIGNEAILNCGFHITMDTDVVKNADYIRITCIDYDDNISWYGVIGIGE